MTEDHNARHASAHIPTVFIGLGGTGVGAVRLIGAYAEPGRNGHAAEPLLAREMEQRVVTTIGIDTDPSEFNPRALPRDIFPRARLAAYDDQTLPETLPMPHRAVPVRRAAINDAVDLVRDAARNGDDAQDPAAAEQVRAFLPLPQGLLEEMLPRSDEAQIGARQFRGLGRLGFLVTMPEIEAEIRNALKQIEHGRSNNEPPQVAIFCSIAGGTGAGMFLDVAFLIRKFLDPRAVISLHLMLPELFIGLEGTPRVRPNAYAALKELSTVARPTMTSPLTLDYSSDGEVRHTAIRPGDPTVINHIYLYGRSCAQLDHETDPSQRPGLQLQCAQRAMADAAIALSLRRLQERNKQQQNNSFAPPAGDTRAASRVFGSAGAARLLADGAQDLGGILASALAEKAIWSCIDAAEPPRTLMRDFDAAFAPILDAVGTHKSKADFAPEQVWPRLFAASPEGAGAALRTARGKLSPQTLRAALETHGLGPICKAAVAVLSSEEDAPLMTLTLDGALVPESGGETHGRLASLLDAADRKVSELEKAAAEGKTITDENIVTLGDAYTSLAALQTDSFKPRALEKDLPDVFRRNRSLLLLAYGDEEQSKRAGRWISWGGPGPMEAEVLALVQSARQMAVEMLIAQVPGTLDRFALLCDRAANVSEAQRLAARVNNLPVKFEDNRKLQKGAIDVADRRFERRDHDPERTKRLSKRFRSGLANMETWAMGLNQPNGAQPARSGEETRRVAAAYDALTARLKSVLQAGEFGPLECDVAEELQKFIAELCDGFRSARNAVAGQENPLESLIADALEETLLKDFMKGAHAIVTKNRFEHRAIRLRSFADAFIAMLLTLPEFEEAALGAPAQLQRAAARIRSARFRRSHALGGRSYDAATLFLAPRTRLDASAASSGFDAQRHLGYALGAPVRVESDDEISPLLVHQSGGFAAQHLRGIEELRDAYLAEEKDRRALFHALPGAVDYPSPGENSGARSADARWTCDEHGEPQLNALDWVFCAECLREYEVGERRLQQICTRPSDHGARAIPDDRLGVRRDKTLSPEDARHFDDGVEEADWAARMPALTALLPEGKLHGVWNPADPPHLFWPQAPTHGMKSLEPVFRKTSLDGRFMRVSTRDPLKECHHCGFPLLPLLDEPEGLHSMTCPRCRRELHRCEACTDAHHVYVQMIRGGAGGELRSCARCSTVERLHET